MGKKPEQQPLSMHNDIWENNDTDEYSQMEQLEMLESLREDMEELGVQTLQEVISRIEELHQRLDAR